MSEGKKVIRVITWIAAMIAVMVSVIMPLGYFTISFQHIAGSLEAEAEINGRIVTRLINANPELWRFEQMRLEELLARRPYGGEKETRRILGLDGMVIAESVNNLTPPLVIRRGELKDAGVTVGRVEISRSLTPLLGRTCMVALFGFSVGVTLFIILRVLPIRALRQAQDELTHQENLAMLGRIAGNMGNELLNPLGVMSNAVFYLGSVLTAADETVRGYLEIINSEIGNSRQIIADLLDFVGAKAPMRKVVKTDELIHGCLGKCAIPECVHLRVDLPDMLPKLNVDPHQMGQVLQNLVTNAVQAMPDGGALTIAARPRVPGSRFLVPGSNQEPRTKNQELDADFIEISVADTGLGISRENMEKLFQPLFSTKSRGIGLGLAISQQFVEANGGRIELESELGKGTTFRVMLPVGSEKCKVQN